MKANELMIGDWVKVTDDDTDDSFIGQVKAIDALENVNVPEGEDVAYPYSIDCLEPIPLTPEILEENGFTRFGTDYILKERHFGLENPSTPSNYFDNYWLRVSIKAVHIEFVHQLQHALRLCGIEKEITL